MGSAVPHAPAVSVSDLEHELTQPSADVPLGAALPEQRAAHAALSERVVDDAGGGGVDEQDDEPSALLAQRMAEELLLS